MQTISLTDHDNEPQKLYQLLETITWSFRSSHHHWNWIHSLCFWLPSYFSPTFTALKAYHEIRSTHHISEIWYGHCASTDSSGLTCFMTYLYVFLPIHIWTGVLAKFKNINIFFILLLYSSNWCHNYYLHDSDLSRYITLQHLSIFSKACIAWRSSVCNTF